MQVKIFKAPTAPPPPFYVKNCNSYTILYIFSKRDFPEECIKITLIINRKTLNNLDPYM